MKIIINLQILISLIHENHHISLNEDISIKEIKTEKEKYDLAKKLLRNNLTIPFPFPIQTFKLIKFYYQKQKSKIFYDNFQKESIPKMINFLSLQNL